MRSAEGRGQEVECGVPASAAADRAGRRDASATRALMLRTASGCKVSRRSARRGQLAAVEDANSGVRSKLSQSGIAVE
jgi:hypothetical protein